MTPNKLTALTLTLAGFSALLACAPAAQAATPRPPTTPIPVWVLRDADALRGRLEHLRRQILVQTRTVGEQRWRTALRPQLARTLVARGLGPDDAEALLVSVDAARARR